MYLAEGLRVSQPSNRNALQIQIEHVVRMICNYYDKSSAMLTCFEGNLRVEMSSFRYDPVFESSDPLCL